MDDASNPSGSIEPVKSARGSMQGGGSQLLDRQLLAAIARGDDDAFVQLYERHAAVIFNYLLRLIHDEKLAEDLLQETFVAVWQGAGAFGRRSKAKTWIFTIAHNKAVSWLRRYRPEALHEESHIAAEEPDPEARTLTNWRNEELLAALDKLSPNHRAVVELSFAQEMSYAEIARIMECPVGTVKSRMSYALRRLYGLLIDTELK